MTSRPNSAQSALHAYESLAAHSLAMLNAARQNDWDAVARMELDCAQLVTSLQGADALAQLDQTGKRRRAELMHLILAQDAELRQLSQPWATRLTQTIGLQAREAER